MSDSRRAITPMGLTESQQGRVTLTALAETFQHVTTASEGIPSVTAELSKYAKNQAGSQRILDGRCPANKPDNTLAPPIQLYHPAFAFFSSKASDPTYVVPEDVIRETRYLLAEFAQLPSDDLACRRAVWSIIRPNEVAPGIRMAQDWRDDRLLSCSYLIFVVPKGNKNKTDGEGLDPSVQAGFEYLRSQLKNKKTYQRCCCPAFIVVISGPYLLIMGGVILDRCIVQRLTDFIWVPLRHSFIHGDEDQYRQMARVLYALRESIDLLDSWYSELSTADAPYDGSPVFHPRFWPSPTAYKEHGTDTLVEFTYQRPLKDNTGSSTYLAKIRKTDQPKYIVVKFVTSYGAEAHEYMTSKGLAPRLLYYGEINVSPDMPSYGNLRMVVTEHVNGQTLDDAPELPSSFTSDLERAFKHLHDGGYVFGNLGRSSVLVLPESEATSGSAVQLVGFDWAGREGEVKYPVSIDLSADWPEGVQGLAYIKKEYDVALLESLKL